MTSDPLVDSERTESSTESAKWVGASCGQHGSYTFYKGVRFHWMSPEVVANNTRVTSRRSSNGRAVVHERYIGDERILAVGDTFFVKVTKSEPVCIGQLILLWHDDANSEDLASLRLYYLPDAIPSGRQLEHGRDEVLAVAEKITIRTSDISTWIIEPEQWDYGCKMFLPQPNTKSKKKIVVDLFSPDVSKIFMARSFIDLDCVNNEKKELIKKSICDKHQSSSSFTNNENLDENCSSLLSSKTSCRKCCNYISLRQRLEVVVLGYGEYCRYRSALKKLGTYNTNSTTLTSGNKRRVVFCRDSFEYPELIQNPLVCEEYAPVFKGRPRKKKTVKHSSRFTRTKTLKNGTKLTSEQEEDAVSARRKSSRTRDKKQPIKSPIYSIYSSQESRKTKRKRDNSCSSSTGSDSQNINNHETRPDLRRSKRKRKNSSNDLKIALQNSLKDFGPQSLDLVNSEANENQNIKRKLSPTSGRSSANLETEFEKRSSSERKRYPSTSSTESSAPSSPQSLNEESANPSPSSSTQESMSGNTSGSDFSEDFSVMGTSVFNLNFEDENIFTKSLMKFMELRGSPINKIPSLGFKRLNLHAFFMNVKKEGGYQKVTEAKMWRTVYKNTGANPSSTSAATCTRKHYEKLLLPFEEFLLKKPGSKINIKRMKRDAQRMLKEEARKTPRMPTRRQKMLISENIECENTQNHALIEEMEEMKTSERDEEVDESEKLKDQLPVDLETKEVEDKVDERLVIQDEPLDLSLPKPTSTTSTEVVNGQCNWSKTSQSKQKLSFKNPFIPKTPDVSSNGLPNYKPNTNNAIVKTSSPVTTFTTYNNQQLSSLFNGQTSLRPYPNCDEANRHKPLTTERILNTKPVHEVQRKPKETSQYPESTSSRSYYRPNSLLGHFRNNRQQTHVRANSSDSTKHILTNGAPTMSQTTPPIGSVRSLPQTNSLAQQPQTIKPKVPPSSASLQPKRSDYEARSIMTSSHARLPKYTSSSSSSSSQASNSASHKENETQINNKRPKTFPMTHFDPSGLINATSSDRSGSSTSTDLLKVPTRLTRPGEAHNSKINFQSLPGRSLNHVEDKSKQFTSFSPHENLSAKMYLKRMKESSNAGRNGHQPLLMSNLPSPDYKKRSIDKNPNIPLPSNRAHDSWKSSDPVTVSKPVPDAMRTASRDLASSSRSRVSNDRKDLNGSHRIPSYESRDRNIHFSSSSSKSNPQRSNRDVRSLPFSVDGFLLSSKDSKSSQQAKSRPEVKEVPKNKPETASMSATNFIRHQIPGINYPMLPAQLAPFHYPHGQHPFLFDLNSALSIPPMYASPEEQALALQYIQQSLFHPTGLESVMRHMPPGFPFNAAQRLPDSAGIPLSLGLDPALLHTLPQPPAAAFAFQNHSSHTPPVARPPNFRPFRHNNC